MTVSKQRIHRNFVRARSRFNLAVDAVNEGATMRSAARIAHLPLSTFFRRLKRVDDPVVNGYVHHRRALTAEEEDTVIELIKKYASHGYPIGHETIKDAVEIVVSQMDEDRRKKLPFSNNRPGHKFLRLFKKRHQKSIAFARLYVKSVFDLILSTPKTSLLILPR